MIIVVAHDKNRLIGMDGILPWYEPEDLVHFRKLTLNATVVMGRKTWDSLPKKPLPKRHNIVISRNISWGPKQESVDIISNLSEIKTANEVFVIGGASIYNLALQLGYVDKIIASEMKFKTDISGKNSLCYFPTFNYKSRRVTAQYTNFDVVEYLL